VEEGFGAWWSDHAVNVEVSFSGGMVKERVPIHTLPFRKKRAHRLTHNALQRSKHSFSLPFLLSCLSAWNLLSTPSFSGLLLLLLSLLTPRVLFLPLHRTNPLVHPTF